MEEEDEVVGEFDVLIGQQMPNQLYLLQFPLRPSWRPYDIEQLKAVRMKKEIHKVEMDFRVNTKGENYNKDWKDKAEGKDDTFTLTSTRMQPKTKYAIGVLNADGFHLTSLPNVLQMRPDMSGCKVGGVRLIQDPKSEDKAPRQAQSKQVAEMMAKQQQRLFSAHQEREAREPWAVLSHFLPDSLEATAQLPHLYCNSTTRTRTGITPVKYLDAIFQPVKSEEAHAVQRWAKVPLSRVLDAPAARRIYSILLSAHVLSFGRLRELVTPDGKVTDTELIAHLEMCAVLVQGNWVIKAQQQYRGQVAAIREFLIYRFTQDPCLSKLEFTDSIPNRTTPFEDIANLFKELAVLDPFPDRPGGMWRLKCPPDEAFMAAHPATVAKQATMWETRAAKILLSLTSGSNALTLLWAPPDPGASPEAAAAAAAAGGASEAQSPARVLQRFLLECFRKFGVCSPAILRAEYRTKKADGTSPLAMTTEELYNQCLSKMTRPFNDCLVLSRIGVPEFDKWRDPMLQVFQERKENKKDQVVDRIKELIGEEIPAGIFGKLVRELATPSTTRSTWTAKAGFMGKSPGEPP